jgi:hypothetical protein
MTRRCPAALALLGLAACGGAAPPPSAPSASRATSASRTSRAPRAAEPPLAVRGRLLVGAHGGRAVGSWVEIEVPADAEAPLATCERLLEREARFLERAPLDVTVGRPCAAAPLPPPPVGAGWLLVDRRAASAFDPATLDGDSGPVDGARVTHLSAFARQAACEDARAALLEEARARRDASAASARRWLADELARRAERARAVCAELDELASRCRDREPPGAAAACAPAPGSPACRRAQDETLRYQADCEVPRVVLRRRCENERALVELLRERLEAPPPSDAPTPAPACRPVPPR